MATPYRAPPHSKTYTTSWDITAIPVPDVEVPYAEVLEFKHRRAPELIGLRSEIERLSIEVGSAGDSALALSVAVERVDTACTAVLSAAKSSSVLFRMTDWEAPFAFAPGKSLSWGASALAATKSLGLPHVSAFAAGAAGAAANIKIVRRPELGIKQTKKLPYEYVSSFHEEFL